jgi:excisionase family DNA binding protein
MKTRHQEADMDYESLPATITVEHAAEILGISRSSAYRAVARGEIPVIRIGRRLLVPAAKFLAMLGVHATANEGAVA